MPKQRITKEAVVEAAFQLARQGGMEAVLVKDIAGKLHCSVQPVYCYCSNMEGLKQEVISYTEDYIQKYVNERIDPNDLFKSIGLAHAGFVKEEPHLYRLYFLRKREQAGSIKELLDREAYINRPKSHTDARPPLTKTQKHLMIYNIGLSFILSALGDHSDPDEVKVLLDEACTLFSAQPSTSHPDRRSS